ncbi:MAG: hypothetical protein E7414_01050 [Ruminococcaceae bacterium]|nr:hypothetical protein [Oscillospiraceae bacterium]
MTVLGWVLLLIGALITFLAKPVLQKKAGDGEMSQKALYMIKTAGMWIVIAGAILIFLAGGIVNV